MTFTEYCEKNGIKLMKDDIEFIKSCLKNIPDNYHKKILKFYIERWKDTKKIINDENKARLENSCRRRANLFLLELSRNPAKFLETI